MTSFTGNNKSLRVQCVRNWLLRRLCLLLKAMRINTANETLYVMGSSVHILRGVFRPGKII
jgi:hypothetical protein